MKRALGIVGLIFGLGVAAPGQVTNIQTETNSLRLEWTAMPGNPYRVYVTPDLADSDWINLTPTGLVFSGAQGAYVLPAGPAPAYYCATASDYLVVDLSEGPAATHYSISYTNAAPESGWSDEYKATALVLRRIPGGDFLMGSPTNELGREPDEFQHPVRLTKDYYIGVFEVTQMQWNQVMDTWPSYFRNSAYRAFRPVEQVRYRDIRGASAGAGWPTNNQVDANSFMGRLRAKTGQMFDLPTEAQWERAGRAGTATALNSGYNLTSTNNDAHMEEVGRYSYNGGADYAQYGDASVGSADAGSYLPNAWGLYDMHGNVWEWCLDWYGANYSASTVDPVGAASGSARVFRGGGWFDPAWYCRSAGRSGSSSTNQSGELGFRVALPLGP